MFGIGMPEMLLILAVALIVFGPKKLPELAKSLGKAIREFKTATADIKESLKVDDDLIEIKKNLRKTDDEPSPKAIAEKPAADETLLKNDLPDPYKSNEPENDNGPAKNNRS